MAFPINTKNINALEREIRWLEAYLESKLMSYFREDREEASEVAKLAAPDLSGGSSEYEGIVQESNLSESERLVLVLALAPYIRPQALDLLLVSNTASSRSFTEFGGVKVSDHAGFLPSVDTALFLVSSNDIARRLEAVQLFSKSSKLHRRNLISIMYPEKEPWTSARLNPSEELLVRLSLIPKW